MDPFRYLCFDFVFIILSCLVCSLQPCDHLLRRDSPLGSVVLSVFLVFLLLSHMVSKVRCGT